MTVPIGTGRNLESAIRTRMPPTRDGQNSSMSAMSEPSQTATTAETTNMIRFRQAFEIILRLGRAQPLEADPLDGIDRPIVQASHRRLEIQAPIRRGDKLVAGHARKAGPAEHLVAAPGRVAHGEGGPGWDHAWRA